MIPINVTICDYDTENGTMDAVWVDTIYAKDKGGFGRRFVVITLDGCACTVDSVDVDPKEVDRVRFIGPGPGIIIKDFPIPIPPTTMTQKVLQKIFGK